MMYSYPLVEMPAVQMTWPWTTQTGLVPMCEDHRVPMKWAARHGASKGHWHCDECAKARR